MLMRLADALAGDGALRLHFQPVLRADHGTVAFNDVLLRVADGNGGLFATSEFIGVAEHGGLMPEISRWVLQQAAGISPERLSFEIPESALLPDLGVARRLIDSARARGFRFALGGFGSGYKSFEYLRELPVDRVRIDGSVVRSLVADPRQLTLAQPVRNVGVVLAQGSQLGVASPDALRTSAAAWESRFPGGRPAKPIAR